MTGPNVGPEKPSWLSDAEWALIHDECVKAELEPDPVQASLLDEVAPPRRPYSVEQADGVTP